MRLSKKGPGSKELTFLLEARKTGRASCISRRHLEPEECSRCSRNRFVGSSSLSQTTCMEQAKIKVISAPTMIGYGEILTVSCLGPPIGHPFPCLSALLSLMSPFPFALWKAGWQEPITSHSTLLPLIGKQSHSTKHLLCLLRCNTKEQQFTPAAKLLYFPFSFSLIYFYLVLPSSCFLC